MKKKTLLLLLSAACCILMNGCSLYEDIDEEINRCPRMDDMVEPSPWEPQPGGDDQTAGH